MKKRGTAAFTGTHTRSGVPHAMASLGMAL